MIQDPFHVLGLAQGASAEKVRETYLALIREFTPERSPQKFAEIRQAYELLQTPRTRLNYLIFDISPHDELAALDEFLRPDLAGRRLPTDVLLSLAQP